MKYVYRVVIEGIIGYENEEVLSDTITTLIETDEYDLKNAISRAKLHPSYLKFKHNGGGDVVSVEYIGRLDETNE